MLSLKRDLPEEITSYDLLKSFAVITMIIDHVGMYLFPEQQEWRVIGRMSMPVWLFLIGYARTRDLSKLLWIGGSILVLSDVVLGMPVFNLNILFTILLVRLTLDSIVTVFLHNKESMFFISLAVVILAIPTTFFFDYGTHAFLFAMLGYFVRHQKSLSLSNIFILGFMGFAVIIHSLYQQLSFSFNETEAFVSAMGIFIVSFCLTSFKSQTYSDLNTHLGRFGAGALKIMGRHSLEIYVLHLLALKMAAFYMFPENFGLFELKWF